MIVLAEGRIALRGPASEVLADPKAEYDVIVRTGPTVTIGQASYGPQIRPFVEAELARVDDQALFRGFGAGVEASMPVSAEWSAIGAVWAPKYRQATFGAFLTNADNARRALDFAFSDVLAAYEAFLAQAPADRPIILAAHSQGSLHLMRLLQERIRGAPEAERIVAAYVVGWPVSESADLPAIPLPVCRPAEQARCLLSWQSFSEPADPSQVTEVYDPSVGPGGASRNGSNMVCTNPLTGAAGGSAGAERNLGSVIPNEDFSTAAFRRGAVPARCGPRGFLLIGDNDSLPEMGPYALPGNNYHVYDYALFWANVRADAERRLATYLAQ